MRLWSLCIWFLFPLLSQAALHQELTIGEAVYTNGKPAYEERSEATYDGNRIQTIHTKYYLPDSTLAGEIRFNFKKNLYLPDSEYLDYRRKRRDTLTLNLKNRKIEVSRKENKKPLEKESLPWEGAMASGAGMFFYARDHLKELVAHEQEHFRAVIPGRLADFAFRLSLIPPAFAARKRVRFRMDIDNWFFRIFLSSVEIEYDPNTQRPISYEGPSGVAELNGKRPQVRIAFQHTPLLP